MAKGKMTKAQVKAATKVTYQPHVATPDVQRAEGIGPAVNPQNLPHMSVGPGVDAVTLQAEREHNAQFVDGEYDPEIPAPTQKMTGGTVRSHGSQIQDSNQVSKSIFKINDEPREVIKGTIGNKKTVVTKR